MSDIVEKQDVDISKIFKWGMVYDVIDPRNNNEVETSVYMKLLGDADLGRARVYALRKSAELRRKLKDVNSDEHVAWIRDMDEMTNENIIDFIVIFSSRELVKNVREKVRIPTPKPPKADAELEKLERFQREVDEYPQKREKAIADALNKEIENLKKSLSNKSKEELYQQYLRLLVDEFCEREAINAFEDYQTYLGCYIDNTYKPDKRFFKDFEEFDNLEPSIKVQFKDAYKSIDIDMSELKKLRRATQ